MQWSGDIVGLFAALNPLLLCDPMRGVGRYDLAQGVIATVVFWGQFG
jgi:hypothetical protein